MMEDRIKVFLKEVTGDNKVLITRLNEKGKLVDIDKIPHLYYGMKDVYFVPAKLNSAGRKKENIQEIYFLKVDIDFHEENQQVINVHTVLEHLESSGILPKYIINTGRGYHLYFPLSKPVNSETSEKLNKALIAFLLDNLPPEYSKLIDRKIFNSNRIMRLPGTLNTKSNSQARFVYINENIVNYFDQNPMIDYYQIIANEKIYKYKEKKKRKNKENSKTKRRKKLVFAKKQHYKYKYRKYTVVLTDKSKKEIDHYLNTIRYIIGPMWKQGRRQMLVMTIASFYKYYRGYPHEITKYIIRKLLNIVGDHDEKQMRLKAVDYVYENNYDAVFSFASSYINEKELQKLVASLHKHHIFSLDIQVLSQGLIDIGRYENLNFKQIFFLLYLHGHHIPAILFRSTKLRRELQNSNFFQKKRKGYKRKLIYQIKGLFIDMIFHKYYKLFSTLFYNKDVSSGIQKEDIIRTRYWFGKFKIKYPVLNIEKKKRNLTSFVKSFLDKFYIPITLVSFSSNERNENLSPPNVHFL